MGLLRLLRNESILSRLKLDSKFIISLFFPFRLKMDPSIDLSEVVRHIPENFTGADFSALTSETYMIAVK